MATPAVSPDFVMGIAGKVTDAFEARQVEELTPHEISASIAACKFVRDLLAKERQAIESDLNAGVNAKIFAARCEGSLTGLNSLLPAVQRIASNARDRRAVALAEFVSNVSALTDDIASLQRYLAEVIAKAKTPIGPIDWARVQDAEAAHARGKTKPFQRSSNRTPAG